MEVSCTAPHCTTLRCTCVVLTTLRYARVTLTTLRCACVVLIARCACRLFEAGQRQQPKRTEKLTAKVKFQDL